MARMLHYGSRSVSTHAGYTCADQSGFVCCEPGTHPCYDNVNDVNAICCPNNTVCGVASDNSKVCSASLSRQTLAHEVLQLLSSCDWAQLASHHPQQCPALGHGSPLPSTSMLLCPHTLEKQEIASLLAGSSKPSHKHLATRLWHLLLRAGLGPAVG